MTDYPNNPGFRPGAPETSREAAESVAGVASSRREKVLALLNERAAYGATADEVSAHYGWERHSSAPRISELNAAGKIVDSEKRRLGQHGRPQAVWIIAPPKEDDGQASLPLVA